MRLAVIIKKNCSSKHHNDGNRLQCGMLVCKPQLPRRPSACDQGPRFLAVQRRAAEGFDKASGEVLKIYKVEKRQNHGRGSGHVDNRRRFLQRLLC